MNDLLGGQVQAILISQTLAPAKVRSGKLDALAVTSEYRSSTLPQVATFPEAGYRDFTPHTWTDLFLPAGAPPVILQRLHGEYAATIRSSEVLARLGTLGAEPVMSSPSDFTAYLKNESDRLGKVIRERGISAD